MRRPDVLIVGGGIIGCALAYYLAKEGVRATVLERGEIGGEASGASAGMLAPLAEAHGPGPFLDLALKSLNMFPVLVEELQELTGIDTGYSQCGLLRVSFSPADDEQLRARYLWLSSLGMGVELLRGEEARLLEPRLSPQVTMALLSPQEGQVEASSMTQALAEAARRLGASIEVGAEALGLLHRKGRVMGVRTSRGRLLAATVMVAAGAWSGRLLKAVGIPIDTPPVRGQMVAYRGLVVRHIIWGPEGYLVPKTRGFTYAGATVERVGFRPHTTRAGLRRLRRMAGHLVPFLARAEVASSWAGLRPGSPDGLPVIGPLPRWEGLWVATGHFRNGVLLAPITGQALARWLVRGEAAGLEPFSPARFFTS